MCPADHLCTCIEDIHSGIKFCELCGDIICPCGSHDNLGLSRITGYIQEVGNEKTGWNNGKKAELIQRQRYDIS
jgi:anaerobic ribonucleoside-triphosphate reductase